MAFREITTQAELDALPAGTIASVRSGHFEAYDSASVSASDSASVTAYDSASVSASDSASVTAYDSASVRASGSASVTASKGVAIHRHTSSRGAIKGGVVIEVPDLESCDAVTWLDWYGIDVKRGVAVLFKAVRDDYQTGRGAEWTYAPGNKVTAKDFDPTRACGQGLHLCAAPHISLRYLEGATKFVAVKVKAADLIPLGDKVKAPTCTVLHEVDEHGRKIS